MGLNNGPEYASKAPTSGSVGRGRTEANPELRDSSIGRESPERAAPSLVGVWGNPQTPFRSASRQGSKRTSGQGRVPTRGPGPYATCAQHEDRAGPGAGAIPAGDPEGVAICGWLSPQNAANRTRRRTMPHERFES